MNILKITKADFCLIGIIVLLSLGIRSLYYSVIVDEFWFMNPMVDSVNYDDWARNILNGNILGEGAFKHSPLYPYFLSLVYFLFGASVKKAIIFQFCISIICSILIYLITSNLFSRKTGFISAIISSIYGPSLFFEANILSTTFINLINICLIISIYISIENKKHINWFFTGLILGLAILARPNILLIVFFLCFFVFFYQKENCSYKHILLDYFVLFFATIIIISPSLIRNKIIIDEFLITVNTGGINFYLGNNKDATGYHENVGKLGLVSSNQSDIARDIASFINKKELSYGETSKYWYKVAFEEIVEKPGSWLKLLSKKILLFFNYYEYTTSLNYYLVYNLTPNFNIFQLITFAIICPLGITGMFLSLTSMKKLWPLYGFFIVYFTSNILMLVSSEYRFAIMPIFYIFSGLTITSLFDQIYCFSWRKLFFIILSIFLIAMIVSLDIVPLKAQKKHLALGYVNYAGIYRNLGKDDRAAMLYQKAMDLSTSPQDYAWCAANYALMLLFLGNTNEALKNIEKAYAISPDNTEFITIYSFILTTNGSHDKAISMGIKAMNIEPNNIELVINLGKTYLWARKDPEAEKIFRMAIQIDPKIAPTINKIKEQILRERNN